MKLNPKGLCTFLLFGKRAKHLMKKIIRLTKQHNNIYNKLCNTVPNLIFALALIAGIGFLFEYSKYLEIST
jgi:hypothetical protein